VLEPGLATAIGSLPHTDPWLAAEVVLRELPDLPAVPQLPGRDPREGMLAQWLGALPEVEIAPDGSVRVAGVSNEAPVCSVTPEAHSGLLALLDVCNERGVAPGRLKVQVTGPLTLGTALVHAGVDPVPAFRRSFVLATAWATAIQQLVARRVPGAALVLVFDEPGLVQWSRGTAPLEREVAIDVLSGALAAVDCISGVHVCGDGDLGLALESGPDVLGVEVADRVIDEAVALEHFLGGEGWIAWGAIPTDRPVGDSVEPHWRRLLELWRALAARGCDPETLRSRALVTPACGLAGYGATQAERMLGLTRQLADRLRDPASTARLVLGA